MGDGSLTQEEIDLLLQGADDVGPGAVVTAPAVGAGAAGGGGDLSPLEREEVGDIIHGALQAGTQGLGLILSRTVRLGAASVDLVRLEDLGKEYAGPFILFSQQCSGSINGTLALIMPSDAAVKISAIVMGGSIDQAGGTDLDSAQIATVKDAIGPMLFSVATQISVKIGSAITPLPVDVTVLGPGVVIPLKEGPEYLRVQIPFTIEGAVNTKIALIMPLPMARTLQQLSRNRNSHGGNMRGGNMESAANMPTAGQTGIQNVDFPALPAAGPPPTQTNMNLLMDVQMTLTVELGRTKMYIKEILGLGEGSIIELDKLAGEPVDLLVNGKLIAKGEVVVIDENFGVRVTDIVSPIDRLKQQQQQ